MNVIHLDEQKNKFIQTFSEWKIIPVQWSFYRSVYDQPLHHQYQPMAAHAINPTQLFHPDPRTNNNHQNEQLFI